MPLRQFILNAFVFSNGQKHFLAFHTGTSLQPLLHFTLLSLRLTLALSRLHRSLNKIMFTTCALAYLRLVPFFACWTTS
jgi:hypothetical protein